MKFQRRHHRILIGAGRFRGRVLVRCLLMLAVWQGPLPWIHCHGTLATSETRDAGWLCEHLRTYHPTIAPCAGVCFGWHVHASFGDVPTENGEPPRPCPQRFLATCGDDALTTSGLTFRAEQSCGETAHAELQRLAVRLGAPGRSAVRGTFFETFAPTLALPVRLGVSRC